MKEKGPIRHGRSHLKEVFHSDEKRHDLQKHAKNHLKNILKEVMGEILVENCEYEPRQK